MKSHLPILSLNCWAIGILFIKLLPMPIWSSVFPILSYSSFSFLSSLRSLIHFELMLVQGKRLGSSFCFQQGNSQFPSTICWSCLFSNSYFGLLCWKWNDYSLNLLFCSICLNFSANTMIYFINMARYCGLRSSFMIPLVLLFVVQDCFGYLRSFMLPYEH
jgi:hypothetical protein